MDRKKNFTEGAISLPIFQFVLPMILAHLLQMAYNIADSSAVGSLVGNNELAAVSAVGSFSGLIINLLTGIGVGASVLVARFFGARDERGVCRSVHTSMILSLIIGAFFTIAALLIYGPVIELYIKEPLYVPIAKRYMGIICLGIPAVSVYNFASAVMRALGNTKTPLGIGMTTGIVNVALNYTLILCVDGLGERGAAIATVIAQYLSAVAIVVYMFVRKNQPYSISMRSMQFDRRIALESLRLGIPAGIQTSCLSLSNIVLNSAVTALPPEANAKIAQYANSIVHSLTGVSWSAVACYPQAITAYTGQNYGAGRLDRIKRGFGVILLQSEIVLVSMVSIELLASPFLCRLFISENAPAEETIALAIPLLAFVMIPYTLAILMDLLQGALRGLGCSTAPMIISLITVVGFRIVWSQVIFPLFTPDANSIYKLYLCYIISYCLSIAALVIYALSKWRKIRQMLDTLKATKGKEAC